MEDSSDERAVYIASLQAADRGYFEPILQYLRNLGNQ